MTWTTGNDPIPEARAALDRLRDRVAGEVVVPGHPDYDAARAVWNGREERFPYLVVRAATIDDALPVLDAVRETGLPLAVRGGGHSVAGLGTVDDGIVLDLGALREVAVDPATHLVTAAPGARVGDVDAATAPHRLAVPLGTVPSPGIAGMTLGGGVGWLSRKAGLSLDRLEAADVLLADGRRVRASEEEHRDLFWALRGGGGNFGVVTAFTYRAVPVPETVLGASLYYRPDRWRRALGAFERWSRDLPDELAAVVSIASPPPEDGLGDDPWLAIHSVWIDEDHARGETLIGALRRALPPDRELSGPVSWEAWQGARSEAVPTGARGLWRNASFRRLDEEVLDALAAVAEALPGPGASLDLHLLGGAFARVPEGTTAFPHRGGRLMGSIHLAWQDPGEDARFRDFAERAAAELARLRERGEYVNFRSIERTRPVPEVTREAYGAETYRRLQRVKQVYDPGNMFRRTLNVAP